MAQSPTDRTSEPSKAAAARRLAGRIRAVWAVRLLLAKPLIERGGMDSSMIDGKDLSLCQLYPTPSIAG